MGYVQEILQKDEDVIYRASIHRIIYLPGILLIILGFTMLGIAGAGSEPPGAGLAVLLGFVLLVLAAIRRRTTELVVTDRRVISKTGWISRKSSEIDRAAIESVLFRQSMLGRLLRYGTVEVRGRGGGIAPMRKIDNPVEFRKQVYPEGGKGGETLPTRNIADPAESRNQLDLDGRDLLSEEQEPNERAQLDHQGSDVPSEDREPSTKTRRPRRMRRIVVALLLVILVPVVLLFVAILFVPVDENPRVGSVDSDVADEERVLVTEVQRALKSSGLDPGPVDGVMGTKTRAAIRRFQERHGLQPDGEATEGLLTAIRDQTGEGATLPRDKVETSAERDGLALDGGSKPKSLSAPRTAVGEGDGPTYSVIGSDAIPRVKLSLDVRLDRRASEQELAAFARQLKDSARGTYERTFIAFYLPGMAPGAGAWATAIFDAGLKVFVFGMTPDQERALTRAPPTTGGDIIGVWVSDGILASRITIFRENGVPHVQQQFNYDGSESTKRLLEQETSSGRRYEFAEGSATGDHFVITRSGTLEIRDDEGTISVARPVK